MQRMSLTKRTYQRHLPILIVSVIAAILMAQYFVKYEPIDTARGALLTWANVVSLMVWAFANVMLIINSSRRVIRARADRRAWSESVVILLSFVLFLLIAFIDPVKLDQNPTYSAVFRGIIGSIFVATEATQLTYTNFQAWRRIVSSRLTPEIAAFLVVHIVRQLRLNALAYFYIPQIIPIGDWIEQVPYTALYRGITIVAAVSTLTLAIRTLVGREAGVIETEMG